MIEVIPNIYLLQLPLPDVYLKYINIYLIPGDDKHLLIDTGWNTEESFDSLRRQLSEIGIDFRDISQIVATHIHPDHYGMAGRLKQLSKAKIALHYRDKELIDLRYVDMDELLQQMAQWFNTNGVPTEDMLKLKTASVGMAKFVAPVLPDITLQGGETITTGSFSLQVVWTPGHSPGHICLYEPTQKILISGDHILPTITPNISLHPQSSNNPLDDYLNSLNQLKQLDVSLILPAHGNPFTGLQQRIEELILHHEQRKSEILVKIKAKPKTAYQIATEISWMTDMNVNGVNWDDLTPLDKRIAVLEILAHLESMRVGGKVARFSRESIIYYQLPDITR